MKILYTYSGPRDPDLETAIRDDLGKRFAEPRQTATRADQDDMTTVTLEFPGPVAHGAAVIEALKGHPRIIEAAEESFGEGV